MVRHRSRLTIRLAVATVSIILIALPQPVSSAGTVHIQQQIEFRYAQSITFRMEASSDVQMKTARVKVERRDGSPLYEKVIDVGNQTQATVEATVTTTELGIGAFVVLASQWEVTDDSGTTYLSDPVQVIYQDQNVVWDWRTLEDSRFVVHWDGVDEALAAQVLDAAHASLNRTERLIGSDVEPEPIHIFVYRDLTSMASALRLHKQRVNDWVAAYSYPDDRIILVAFEKSSEGSVALERDVSHELAHVLIHAGGDADSVPGWFDEGTAILVSADGKSTSEMLRQEIDNGVLLSIESLCASGFAGLPIHDARLAYTQSASLMNYILERYGASQVRALANVYKHGASCESGVNQALGLSLAQLETQWHSDLETKTLNAPTRGSAVPWAVVWVASIALALCLVMPSQNKKVLEDASLTHASLNPIDDFQSAS